MHILNICLKIPKLAKLSVPIFFFYSPNLEPQRDVKGPRAVLNSTDEWTSIYILKYSRYVHHLVIINNITVPLQRAWLVDIFRSKSLPIRNKMLDQCSINV